MYPQSTLPLPCLAFSLAEKNVTTTTWLEELVKYMKPSHLSHTMSSIMSRLVQLPGACTLMEVDCAICSDGYTEGLGFTCDKCSNSSVGIVVMAVGFVAMASFIVFLVMFLMSGELEYTRGGFVKRLARYIPVQSVKIVIVVWQVLTQVRRAPIILSALSIFYQNTLRRK